MFCLFIFFSFILLMFILGTQHVKMAIAAAAAATAAQAQDVDNRCSRDKQPQP
jgi:hypothetical protein